MKTPAQRRAEATDEINFICKRIIARVAAGPDRRAPTTSKDADRFESISAALEIALTAAIAMSDGID